MSTLFKPVVYFTLGFFLGMYTKFEYKYTNKYDCKNTHCTCDVVAKGKCEKTTQILA